MVATNSFYTRVEKDIKNIEKEGLQNKMKCMLFSQMTRKNCEKGTVYLVKSPLLMLGTNQKCKIIDVVTDNITEKIGGTIIIENLHLIPKRDERRIIWRKISQCISDQKNQKIIYVLIPHYFKTVTKLLKVKRVTLNNLCWDNLNTKWEILESIKNSAFYKDSKFIKNHIKNILNLRSLSANELLFLFGFLNVSQYFKANSKYKIPIKTLINLYKIFSTKNQTEMASKSCIINTLNLISVTLEINIKITKLNVIFDEDLISKLGSNHVLYCGLLIFDPEVRDEIHMAGFFCHFFERPIFLNSKFSQIEDFEGQIYAEKNPFNLEPCFSDEKFKFVENVIIKLKKLTQSTYNKFEKFKRCIVICQNRNTKINNYIKKCIDTICVDSKSNQTIEDFEYIGLSLWGLPSFRHTVLKNLVINTNYSLKEARNIILEYIKNNQRPPNCR